MKNFVAFDFETANRSRHSICSVGLVFVKDGKIVDSIYQLINPEEHFERMNMAIHHITPKDVKDAPTFDVFYQTIKDKLDNQIMVAHNISFDGYAFRDNLERYKIQPSTHHLLCTYQLSKKLILGKTSYTLDSLCKHYRINLTNHHHALDDARACAEIMLNLSNEFELNDFESIFNKTKIRPRTLSEFNILPSRTRVKHEKVDLAEIQILKEVDQKSPFFGKNIVFTGKLSHFSRNEAAQMIANKGGKPQNGINHDTNYIVLGNFDDAMIKGKKSTKLLKAEKMISEGKVVKIISEEDFIKML
ncbi:MAG: exonuclease domain-containing protein [Bacillota bacterium]|nr:exonuclease domain-containing protein [Bacillota bacterium]